MDTTRQIRYTPSVHTELRDSVAIIADDADNLLWDYDPEDAAAITSLHAKLDDAAPGQPIPLTHAEAIVAIDHLTDLADTVRRNADAHHQFGDSQQRMDQLRMREHATAARLDRAAEATAAVIR